MRVIERVALLSLLIVVTLCIQNASAMLILPDSSYEGGAWQGSSVHNEDGFYALVDFAVYDTENLLLEGEIDFAEDLDMTGRYIYAYQVFNHSSAEKDIGSFEILDTEGSPIDQSVMHDTSAKDDEDDDSVAPIDPSSAEGIWEFTWGTLIAAKHSWFLILSSEHEPVKGSYQVNEPLGGEDEPSVPTPEPATIVWLGLGSIMILRRFGRSV